MNITEIAQAAGKSYAATASWLANYKGTTDFDKRIAQYIAGKRSNKTGSRTSDWVTNINTTYAAQGGFAKLFALLNAGTPLTEIGRVFGVSRQRVHQWKQALNTQAKEQAPEPVTDTQVIAQAPITVTQTPLSFGTPVTHTYNDTTPTIDSLKNLITQSHNPVQTLREFAHIRVGTIAQAMGITPRTYQKIEAGLKPMPCNPEVISAFYDAFENAGIPDDLVFFAENARNNF